MSNLNVSITENYRLCSDGAQFILRKLHFVDPTRAPGYKAQEGAEAPQLREDWRDDCYYPLTPAGLSFAIQTAILRGTDVENAKSVGEALQLYQVETQRIVRNIDAYLTPNISGEIDALGVRQG